MVMELRVAARDGNVAEVQRLAALGVEPSVDGFGELMEVATAKLLARRQPEHAFAQFALAGELHRTLSGGGELAGEVLLAHGRIVVSEIEVPNLVGNLV